MTSSLAEIIKQKSELETSIRRQLNDLEKQSGCIISGLYLDYSQTLGHRGKSVADVEIKVELPKV